MFRRPDPRAAAAMIHGNDVAILLFDDKHCAVLVGTAVMAAHNLRSDSHLLDHWDLAKRFPCAPQHPGFLARAQQLIDRLFA